MNLFYIQIRIIKTRTCPFIYEILIIKQISSNCRVLDRGGLLWDTAILKKVDIVNSRYWGRKELWVTVIMSDNAPATVVTVWLWHYDEPALYILQSQC